MKTSTAFTTVLQVLDAADMRATEEYMLGSLTFSLTCWPYSNRWPLLTCFGKTTNRHD